MGFYGPYATFIFLPITIIILASNLAPFLRYLIYKLTSEKQITIPVIGVAEQPVLVLEYDKNAQALPFGLGLFLITLSLFLFFFADHIAYWFTYVRHGSIFFLTNEQTYVFYYVALKFMSLVALFCFCAALILTFNRKVIFYKNAVVVENSITGGRELPLDDNVRCNDAGSGGRGIWIYDERKGINLKVYSQNYMDITLEQEKLLTEIISKIPEKTKIFTII
jgi:hypothetical protein